MELEPENLQDTSDIRLSSPVTGFVDYDPKEQALFNQWLQTVRECYESFGFTPLHLRPFEKLNALKGDGDTQKQIFEVFRADTGQTTNMGLPFDHTVPLALWVAEQAGYKQCLSFPFKRYDLGLSYRGERPKTGRFRAFVQADVDIVGKKLGLSADVECIAAILKSIERLNIGSFKIRINHIGIVKNLLQSKNIPESFHPQILRCVDKLDKLTIAEVSHEISKIEGITLNSKEISELLENFSTQYPFANLHECHNIPLLDIPFLADLKLISELFEKVGLSKDLFIFSPGMVRGLDYYTGIVFETFLTNKEQFGSIASGGRYSNLVGNFSKGLEDVEGVGGSIGLTRLFDIMRKTDMIPPNKTTLADILVGSRTGELIGTSYELCHTLRNSGYKVDLYSGNPKIKQILSHANTLGVTYAALVMENNCIVIKNMKTEKQAEFTNAFDAVEFLQQG